MAVTSLGFNIFSTYNGRGVAQAQRSMRGFDGAVKRGNASLAARTRVTQALDKTTRAFGRTVSRVGAQINAHSRSMRAATAAATRLGRSIRSSAASLIQHARNTRAAAAAHNFFSRAVRRSSLDTATHSRMARIASAVHSRLAGAVRRTAVALGGHGRMARIASAATGALTRSTRAGTTSMDGHSRASRRAAAALGSLSGFARRAATSLLVLGRSGGGINRINRDSRAAGGAMRRLATAVLIASPALGALGHAAVGASAAFGAMTAGAGLAAGVFGGVMAAAARRAFELQRAGKALTASQRSFVTSTNSLTAAWNRFLTRTSGATLRPATVAVNGLRMGISRLIPLVNAVSPIAMRVARAFQRWVVADNGMKRLVATITKYGVPALSHLVNAGRHVTAVLGFAFRALAPLGLSLARAIERGARALRGWAAGGGFQRFANMIKANGPAIRSFFTALGGAIRQVSGAAAGMGMPLLRIATLFLRIVANTPQWVFQALLAVFIATKIALIAQVLWYGILAVVTWGYVAAMTALNIVMRANPIVLIVTLIVMLIAAIVFLATKTRFFQTVWNAVWTGIKMYGLFIWNLLKMYWHAFVTAILFIWNLIKGPLLAAWRVVWNAIKIAAVAIWNGMKIIWRGIVFAFIVVWRAVSGALRVAWRAVWNGIRAVGRAIWNGMRAAWRAICFAFAIIWRAVSGALRAAWRAVWNGIRAVGRAIWNGLRAAWRAVCRFFPAAWRAISGALRGAWRAVWNGIRAIGRAIWNGLRAAWRAVCRFFAAAWRAVGGGLRAAWRGVWNAIRTVGRAIWGGLRAAWNATLNFFRRAWNAVSSFLRRGWAAAWNTLKRIGIGIWNFLKRAWNSVKNFFISVGKRLWNGVRKLFAAGSRWIRTTFWSPVKNFFTKTLPNAFKSAVGFIGKAWNALKKTISKPVKAVIDFVYNKGIVKLWNAVAGAFGAPKLKEFHFKGFKEGGYTGNGNPNEPAGIVHKGEYVIPAKEYKQMQKHRALHGGLHGHNGLGPQVLQSMEDGTWDPGMGTRGIRTRKSGGWGNKGLTPPAMYKKTFAEGVGGSRGGPIDDGIGDFFGGVADFFKEVGMTMAGAIGLNGASKTVLEKLGGLALGTIAPVINPIIQTLANKGKDIVRGIIPGAPGIETLIAGKKGRDKAKGGSEGGVGNQGIIQTMADAIKDWITANDATAGCGFTEFRKWKAGDGRRVGNLDVRTRAMLALARKHGLRASITQGSWSHAGASAGTHAGGGAVDLSPPNNKNVGALRSAGFAAWNRGAKWGSPSFSPHIHAIAVGNRNLSPGAAQQVRDFKAGKNGLAGGGKDNFKDSSCSGGKAGDCNSYKAMAAKALKANGLGGSGNLNRFMSQMKQESSCNPRAINKTDSNAKAGMASRGLMQVIPPTFRANHCPGTSNNIYDPYANICASARYQKRRYGRVNGSPYRAGTLSAAPGWHLLGEGGPEMVRFSGGQTVRNHSRSRRMLDSMSGSDSSDNVRASRSDKSGTEYHVHIHGPVYAKSGKDFENMLAGALQDLKRKRRLPK